MVKEISQVLDTSRVNSLLLTLELSIFVFVFDQNKLVADWLAYVFQYSAVPL